MKLNLGCGKTKKQGYINIDSDTRYNPDIVSDIRDLHYDNESIDKIIVCHIIEHVTLPQAIICLKDWHSWLKHGGALYLAIPNWDIMRSLLANRCDLNTWSDVFFGDIQSPTPHQWMMSERSLRELVDSIGFRIDGNFSGWGGSSDFEISSIPISLNLICVKE